MNSHLSTVVAALVVLTLLSTPANAQEAPATAPPVPAAAPLELRLTLPPAPAAPAGNGGWSLEAKVLFGTSLIILGLGAVAVGVVGLMLGSRCTDARCETYTRPDLVACGSWIGTGTWSAIVGGMFLGFLATADRNGSQAALTLRGRF